MTDKEKIIAYIDKLLEKYPKNYYLLMVAEFIDSLQEEPTIPDIVDKHYWEMLGKEPQEHVSDDLIVATNNYCVNVRKGYPRVMDETDRYICNAFKAGANWQKLQDMGITNNRAQDVVANVLSSADNPLDAYATEVAFMMLPATLKESYHQTNRDRIGDAVKLGAKWQKSNLWKQADGDDLPDIGREVIALLDNGKVVFAHRPHKGKYIGKSLTTGNIETFENKTYDKGGWNIPNVKYWLDVELPKETEL